MLEHPSEESPSETGGALLWLEELADLHPQVGAHIKVDFLAPERPWSSPGQPPAAPRGHKGRGLVSSQVLPVEECGPNFIKSCQSRSRPAISTTLEGTHKVGPREIKSGQRARRTMLTKAISGAFERSGICRVGARLARFYAIWPAFLYRE